MRSPTTRLALTIAVALPLGLVVAPASAQTRSGSGAQPAPPTPPPTPASPGQPSGQPASPATGQPTGADEPAEPGAVDVDGLRQEYLKLRDELFKSRARAATVASQLYSTKLTIDLVYTTARYYTIGRATIRLDGANVYDDVDGTIGKDAAPRFEGFVAPGRHLVQIRIEAVGKDDDRFTSVIDDTFTIQAPAGKDVTLVAKARDGGDIPYAWKKKEAGSYSLVLDVKVNTQKRPEAAPAKAASRPLSRTRSADARL
jgi:hypothetical protein